MFQSILCLERKRAERSGRTFLLMLVNVECLLQENPSQGALSEIASTLCCGTRETDITGWYREGRILGVIYTEFPRKDREATESLIGAKVKGALCSRLEVGQSDRIHFSFCMFPEGFAPVDVPAGAPPRSETRVMGRAT